MDTQQILEQFSGLVAEYRKHRNYIAKAKEKAPKYSPEVVQKVILDHEIRSSEIADRILPIVPQLEEVIDVLQADRDEVGRARDETSRKMEELQLRLEIEELTQEEFDRASTDLRLELEKASEQHENLGKEIDKIESALDEWTELARKAEQATGRRSERIEVETEPEQPAVAQEVPRTDVAGRPLTGATRLPEPVVQEVDSPHVSRSRLIEDLSDIYSNEVVRTIIDDRGGESDDLLAIEAGEGEGGGGSSVVPFSHSEVVAQHHEVDLPVGAAHGEAEPAAEFEIHPPEESQESGDVRGALLIYQENTTDEQIYRFKGDRMTIGRSRENDIQIKNDSKVSRQHCEVVRRGSNYYIVDNKSSNGTLVAGEIINGERRLFGGEEIVVGESFLRFRIL